MARDADLNSPELEPVAPRRGRQQWRKILAIAGGTLLVGTTVAGWWMYTLLRRELPQFLQDNLSAALGRPLKVGEFERMGLRGVRLGPSILPPTEDDFSWAKAQALEVTFNPLTLVFTRTLRPNVVFIEPQMAIKQGFDGDWRITPPGSVGRRGWVKTELRGLQIRNADLAIGPISRTSIVELPTGVTSATLILLENVNLRIRFRGKNNQTVSLIVGGRLNNGSFQIRGEAQLDSRQANLVVRAQQIPIELVNPLFGGGLFIRNGLLSSNLDLKVRPGAADPLTVTGTARLRNGDIVITDLSAPLRNINGTLVATGVGGRLEHSSLEFGPILVRVEGVIDLKTGYDLFVNLPGFSLEDLETAFATALPLGAQGQFQVKTHVIGQLLAPQLSGQLQNLSAVQVDRLGLDTLTAQFAANLSGLTLKQITIRPTIGGSITAQGSATLSPEDWQRPNLTLTAQTNLPLDALAALYEVPVPRSIRLGTLLAQAQIAGQLNDLHGLAHWQLPQATFPGQGRLTYGDRHFQAQNTQFQIGSGKLQASADANLDTLNWQARVLGSALPLSLLSPPLRSTLDMDLRVAGNLSALTPAGMRADGQIRLSDTIPLNLAGADRLLPGPLYARFAWTGRRLEVPKATAPSLYASGGADITFPTGGGQPQITGMDFAARLSNLDLGAAYALLDGPAWLQPRGYVDFDGSLRGRLDDPQIAGRVGLRQIAINALPLFEDVSGPIRASLSAGVDLSLVGGSSEISAVIEPSLRPQSFRLTNGEFVAVGQRRGALLDVELSHFDIGGLALQPFDPTQLGLDLGQLSGFLNATAQINLTELDNPAIAASFTLHRPSLGPITAASLSGQLNYRDGQALLTGGHLQLTPQTQFLITGSGQLWPEWQTRAEISTTQADFQDILHTLRLYSYADFGRLLSAPTPGHARHLTVNPLGRPEATLLEQATWARAFRDLGEVVNRQQSRALLPNLDQLEGQISGRLGLAASQSQGLTADFEFSGQNWVWGRYNFDNQFLARGQARNQTLWFDPVEFRAGTTRLRLVGSVSRQDSDLTIQAEGLPLNAATNLLAIPFEVTGLLNLNAHLTGAYTNPQLTGHLAVDQASINQQPLQEMSSRFQYQEAVLGLEGRLLGASTEPLLFSGTVPYALPFMTVQPASDEIALRASLKDDGLALVNIFTPLLGWGGGQANFDVQIGGTLSRPLVNGAIAFDQATFNLPLLQSSLSNLSGSVRMQGTKIWAQSLTGTLFGGSFELTGDLPLTARDRTPADQGLHLALQDIHFTFFNEVRSDVNGYLTVTNALLAPTLGGDVQLQQTQVAVGPQLISLLNQVLANPGIQQIKKNMAAARQVVPVQIDHLRILLEPAKVKAPPLFSFGLEGALTLSGPIPGVYGDGRFDLNDGWLNTVTAEFFLASGRDNVILFRPEYKLDPYLDLILSAKVPLQRKYNINSAQTTTGSAEIPDINPLASNTIFDELLIEARFTGLASRLFENLQLTSNPPYSQNQLLSMVSGGYLSDLGGGEPALVLGANLLTALSADTQDSIGQALGLRRFRLGASTIQPTETGDAFGYSLGVNLGITENLSATFVQVLNQNQPIQFNARYRLDQNWSLEGSSNLSDNHRVFVEYRLNF